MKEYLRNIDVISNKDLKCLNKNKLYSLLISLLITILMGHYITFKYVQYKHNQQTSS